MVEGFPQPDVESGASRFIDAERHRRDEWFCCRAMLDELLADQVIAPVLRSAGYNSDEFREMMTEMARNLVTP